MEANVIMHLIFMNPFVFAAKVKTDKELIILILSKLIITFTRQ